MVSGCKSKLRNFTKTTWVTLRDAALIRQDYVYNTFNEILQKDEPIGTCHPECYARYTNKEHLKRIQNSRRSPRKQKAPDTYSSQGPSPTKRVRRSIVSRGVKEKEHICIICRSEKWQADGKNKERLLKCEVDTVENKIKSAAKIRDDIRVNLDVEGKDLKAIEAMYHRSCYAQYTNPVSLQRIIARKENAKSETRLDPYEAAFDSVMGTINERVLKKKEAISITFLCDMYVTKLIEQNVDTQCRAFKLKEKILKQYKNNIGFVQPAPRRPEYVFDATMKVEDVVKSLLQNPPDETFEDDALDETYNLNDDINTEIYHCGISIHQTLKEMKDTMAWPPTPSDITKDNIVVPDTLFNLAAYIITGCKEPVTEGRVPVNEDTERYVLSIAQDLINVTTRGHIKTVKNIGLAVAVRNITGNKEVLKLLNKFGHTLSYEKITKYEKDLVNKYHGVHRNSIILPQNIEKNVFSTFVWDNNDLCEETLSGAGSTHVTNGIIIQRQV